jgi:hypothetical protein
MIHFIPVITVNGLRIESDRCIWCGGQSNISFSHLIPKCLGGWFKPLISCEACNNSLGTSYESEVMRNAYLTAAISKFEMKPSEEAYRHAIKTHKDSGERIYLRPGNVAMVMPRKVDENTFIGPVTDGKKYFIEKFKRERPNWPTDELEDFFNDPSRTVLRYAGFTYKKDLHRQSKGIVNIELPRDVDPGLIFKMIYEFIAINGLLSIDYIRDFTRRFISFNTENKSRRITIDDLIRKYIVTNTIRTFDKFKQFEDIPFRDYHYFVTRISREGILYFEIVLFGQIRNMMFLGEWSLTDGSLDYLIDRCFIFPIFERYLPDEIFPNIAMKEQVIWGDAAVEYAHWAVTRKSN